MLTLNNISCLRGGKKLFSHLSCSIEVGTPFFITGPNGSGKSSLIKILAGTLPPQEGTITWHKNSIADNEEYNSLLLYVGHNNAIKPELTVYENIRFWAELRGEPILIPAALNYFEMGPIADVPCALLSAGWQRRVALASLITAPRLIWLLDEPATHLDAHATNLLDALISTRCKQGGLVVISTHSTKLPEGARSLNMVDYA